MTQADDGEINADVIIRFRFQEEVRIAKDVVGDRRLHCRFQLSHHVRQVAMFTRHYHL